MFTRNLRGIYIIRSPMNCTANCWRANDATMSNIILWWNPKATSMMFPCCGCTDSYFGAPGQENAVEYVVQIYDPSVAEDTFILDTAKQACFLIATYDLVRHPNSWPWNMTSYARKSQGLSEIYAQFVKWIVLTFPKCVDSTKIIPQNSKMFAFPSIWSSKTFQHSHLKDIDGGITIHCQELFPGTVLLQGQVDCNVIYIQFWSGASWFCWLKHVETCWKHTEKWLDRTILRGKTTLTLRLASISRPSSGYVGQKLWIYDRSPLWSQHKRCTKHPLVSPQRPAKCWPFRVSRAITRWNPLKNRWNKLQPTTVNQLLDTSWSCCVDIYCMM